MPLLNLSAFIHLLEQRKQLARVRQPVSADLEITDWVSKLPHAHCR
jgi:3-polyprenyl-4-hydroxybenzoate decarboxylase